MIYPNGTVWTNYRLKVTGPCNMDLTTFPLDTQKCKLTFESYNYNNNEVKMRWNPNSDLPIKMYGTETLPDFILIDRRPIYKNEVRVLIFFILLYRFYIMRVCFLNE